MREENNYWIRRLRAGTVSRRRVLGGAASVGLGASALALVGCGDDDDDNGNGNGGGGGGPTATATAVPPTPTATPKQGGQYVTAFTGPFAGADPHNSVYGGAGIVPVVYNYLFRTYEAFAPDRGIIYDLAESHQLEADDVTMTFKLRPDVMIAPNGSGIEERALTSDDVLASWERIADVQSGSNGYVFAHKWIDSMDAPDPTTFRIKFTAPYAWGEAQVGNNLVGAIVPRELLDREDFRTKPVGGGPFMLTELAEGAQAKMDRNPNYYRDGRPYLDSYIIRAFSDQATWLTAFQSGQVDLYSATSDEEAKGLVNNKSDLKYQQSKSIGYNSFWMNTKQAPWNDERVRNAVNWATDREEYIQIIGRGDGNAIGPVTYAFEQYALTADELEEAQPFDVNRARQAFEEAGIKEFTFAHPTASNMADYVTIFVRQMQRAGVTAKPQPLDAANWLVGYYTSAHSASLSLNQAYQTPDNALQWFHTGGITGNNHYDTGYSDPEVDAAIDKAAGTLDEQERIQAYKDVQKLILSKGPPFINFFGTYENILLQPYVQGYQFGAGALNTAYADTFWTERA